MFIGPVLCYIYAVLCISYDELYKNLVYINLSEKALSFDTFIDLGMSIDNRISNSDFRFHGFY